jgi:hypothetical protein
MNVHDVIMSLRKPAKVINDTTITLGNVFWPIDAANNLALKFWPQWFRKTASS